MTSLLLIISFLLHIILLAVVYFLYQQIQELKVSHHREMEQLISEFIEEIKKENIQLQHQLQHQSKRPTIKQPIQKKEDKGETTPLTHYEPIQSSLHTEIQDKVETSTESLIFKLHDEGMDIDDIAKQVHRGKTEVELLIKLNKK